MNKNSRLYHSSITKASEKLVDKGLGQKSASTTQDDIEKLDPETFSARGDFLRQLALKMHNFLANTPEENILLTVRIKTS